MSAAGPLEGIRVLDLTSVVLGPLATQVLADFGADVIKIESPQGDMMRANGTSRNQGMSSIFMALNRNKRSVVLDLKRKEGVEGLQRLITEADVLIHNMRVTAIERLGFGYEAVRSFNPGIVYCAATGFGQAGPDRDKPAFDDIIQAACGLVSVASTGNEVPGYVPSLIADKTTGLAVSSAVMAALLHRERSGVGQYVEVPMLETMVAFTLAEHMGGMTFPGSGSPEPAGYVRLLAGGRRPAKTRDGWIALLPYTEKQWNSFFAATGNEAYCARYSTGSAQDRNKNILALYECLAEILPSRTSAEWLALCDELDIPATRIYGLDELPSHPHLQAVKLFEDRIHPSEGPLREIRPTALFSATPTSIRRAAPKLGEHTREVLEEAGVDPAVIAEIDGLCRSSSGEV